MFTGQFTPLKDFFSPETRSQYVVGLSYSVKNDGDHKVLAELVPKWIAEGKVRAGPPSAEAHAKHMDLIDARDGGEKQTIGKGDVGRVEDVLVSQSHVSGKGEVK